MRKLLKKHLALAFLLLLIVVPAFGQTQSETDTTRADTRHELNLGWVGLAGLLGLLGLRRQKSIEHLRMAAAGVKVSTVPVHLPEHS
jgi:MYXO-CTERM domain-containing protein